MPGENLLPEPEPTGLEGLPGYWLGRAAVRLQVARELYAAAGATDTNLPAAGQTTPDLSIAHSVPLSARGLSRVAVEIEARRNLAIAREYERRAEFAGEG